VKDIREIVAKNISELRQSESMTQLALAQKLNYSDKAVSKWERGESFPDIFMLKSIADLFGVSVDYLFAEDHTEAIQRSAAEHRIVRRNRVIISFLANMLIWLIATVAFVTMQLVHPNALLPEWMVFVYALPLSSVVALVFNSIWGKPKLNYVIIASMAWFVLLAFYMTYRTVFGLNIWIIFIIGIPVQIIVTLWAGINNPRVKTKRERRSAENDTAHDASQTPSHQ
jgi:transcriptional regulator with XRE-family HTH domain